MLIPPEKAPFPSARHDAEASKSSRDIPQTRSHAYRLSFLDAARFCAAEGYSMVKIETAAENAFIAAEMAAISAGNDWWIGLSDYMSAVWYWAADLTAGSVAGVWSVSVAGQSCRVATPQTKFGQGYRAGPLGCPAPMDGVKSWNVAGKQLSLYDESGNALARLYSSGAERFDGQTTSGQPISLSR